MDWSGERYIPGVGGQVETEHLHRYAIARALCAGLDVLDIASGEGYGSGLLAERARSVVGVDMSPEAISHAHERYPSPNLQFRLGSCAAIPCADQSFDLVVSFETIEHHDQHEEMMREFRRVLRPDGLLLISSPDKLRYSDLPEYKNPYHLKELYAEEFEDLLRRHFREVKVFGQRVCFGSYVAPFRDDSRQTFWTMKGGPESIAAEKGLADPIYQVALAGNGALPALPCGVFENTKALLEAVVQRRLQKAREDFQSRLRPAYYRLGDVIDFRKGGNSPLYVTEGWAMPQQPGTWSVTELPSLSFELTEPVAGNLQLVARVRPMVAPGHERISVQVSVNGGPVAEWSLDEPKMTEVMAMIPADGLQGRSDLRVEFLIREPRSPKELGLSGDVRKLGICVREAYLQRADR